MEKMAGLQKSSPKVFLSVLAAVSILWTGSSVHAVGPYFENESSPGGRSRSESHLAEPDAPLWSPPNPEILTIESLKKGQIILRNSKESSTAQPRLQTQQIRRTGRLLSADGKEAMKDTLRTILLRANSAASGSPLLLSKRAVEIKGRADQGDMRESLGKIAQGFAAWSRLLGI